jgi:Tfp pilus assembly major pilin PilA
VYQANNPAKQRGMTMISWMLVIGVLVFFVVIGITLIPTYIENYSVKNILASIEQDRLSAKQTPKQIKDTIIKRLKINGVYEFDRDFIKITKEKGGMKVTVDYEVRKHIVGNLDAVMSFNDQVVL